MSEGWVRYSVVKEDDNLYISLSGEGNDSPNTWRFSRAYPISLPEANHSTDVNVKTRNVYLNKERINSSIFLITWDYVRNLNDACERLIDHALVILEKGEELRVILREEKDKFITQFNNTLFNQSLIEVDAMKFPVTINFTDIQ